jgi:hypothetical protein
MAWLTPEDVQDWLELPAVDARLQSATAAVIAEVERVRKDVDFTGSAPDNITLGATLWVAELYQVRNAPSGFPGYGDPGADIYGPIDSSRWVSISRLCGLRRPLAL